MRALVLLILAALVISAVAAVEHQRPNGGLPLVQADFQVCVPVQLPPVRAPKRDVFHPQANAEFS